MIDAVFISDLHLHPDEHEITQRFNQFVKWAAYHAKTVYILGDFFHVWSGDDALDSWSEGIAKQLSWLSSRGVAVFFMHGNRDFLLGETFARLASMTLLNEPTLLEFGGESVMLVHGDRYCTKDKMHQWLRRFTRNAIFPPLFLRLSSRLRSKMVKAVRQHSQKKHPQPITYMDVVAADMLDHMQKMAVQVIIHGHTHKPGLTTHQRDGVYYRQYVLSDWDDSPLVMCYDCSNGFYFTRFLGEDNER